MQPKQQIIRHLVLSMPHGNLNCKETRTNVKLENTTYSKNYCNEWLILKFRERAAGKFWQSLLRVHSCELNAQQKRDELVKFGLREWRMRDVSR